MYFLPKVPTEQTSRAKKICLRMATSIGHSSTLEKLVYIEAILIAILVQLPLKSIFRFKCVSKTWNRILAEPFFLESYYKAARARNNHVVGYGGERFLAFINSRMSHLASFDVLCKHNPYHNPSDTLPLTQNKYNVNQIQMLPTRFGDIYHSYNGLILCLMRMTTFYIINPLTRMWVSLPPIDAFTLAPTGLTWEENTHNLIPIYKVVGVYTQRFREEENEVVIDTYCSKSGKWAKSKLIGREDFKIDNFGVPIVSNGVFYWYAYGNVFVVYNSNRDEKHVQLIKFPNGTNYGLGLASTVSSCDDVLWFGRAVRWEDKMRFWILPKDKQQDGYKQATTVESNEWILMHTICIPSFCQYLDATFARDSVANAAARANINLLGLIPCYPVLAVLSNDKNMFLYNVESKCIELVPHRTSSDLDPKASNGLHPYVESFSLSCYALSTNYY